MIEVDEATQKPVAPQHVVQAEVAVHEPGVAAVVRGQNVCDDVDGDVELRCGQVPTELVLHDGRPAFSAAPAAGCGYSGGPIGWHLFERIQRGCEGVANVGPASRRNDMPGHKSGQQTRSGQSADRFPEWLRQQVRKFKVGVDAKDPGFAVRALTMPVTVRDPRCYIRPAHQDVVECTGQDV